MTARQPTHNARAESTSCLPHRTNELRSAGERMRAARLYPPIASSVIQLPLNFTDLVDIMFVIEQYWDRVTRVPDTSR